MTFNTALRSIQAQFEALPYIGRLRELLPEVDFDSDTLEDILSIAATFSSERLVSLDGQMDEIGCELIDGRVRTAGDHRAVWQEFSELGWNGTECPIEFGGMGLPLVVHSSCEELFNRGSAAFGMLATPVRCGVKLLERYADSEIKKEWLPQLINGTWGATICISEAGAGSDVGRIRTRATPLTDGAWCITGEKDWISFGDHDLTEQIGHMLLARTPDSPPGTAGLSLFLVPSIIADERNNIVTRRVEEKLGLHGSPTCSLGFEGATGYLIGELNRGLPQLFTMIVRMRISVGSQGAAIAGACADLAIQYAAERRQGGPPSSPPVSIDRHGDVQRMLLRMAAHAEVARGLVLTTSIIADLADAEEDPDKVRENRILLAWLLPIVKTFCAETAFDVSSLAVQVLGGAGYTREWPAEQHLRDARILSIYEGTSGIQALDLVERRLIAGKQEGLSIFLSHVEREMLANPETMPARQLRDIVQTLSRVSDAIEKAEPEHIKAGAYHYLRIASFAATGWIALRLSRLGGDATRERLAAYGKHWLNLAPGLARSEAEQFDVSHQLRDEWAAIQATSEL